MRARLAGMVTAGTVAGLRHFVQCSQAEPHQTIEIPQEPPRAHRVLIVGGGLTGSLTAAFLRRRWPRNAENPLELHVWERSSYPSGRFGAVAVREGAVADLGAQVLSVVDPADARARGGHGITTELLHKAFDDVTKLIRVGMLVEAPNDMLCPTEERLNWEGLWRHFWAPKGMSSVLQTLLAEADAHVRFGVRCDALKAIQRGGASKTELLVTGSGPHAPGRWPPWTVGVAGGDVALARREQEVFDAVVVCTPAPNALQIDGVESLLDDRSSAVLNSVQYDARAVHAFFFHADLAPLLSERFKSGGGGASEVAEINVDGEWTSRPGGAVHLIAWQGCKREGASEACVVAHCAARAPGAASALAAGRVATSLAADESVEEVYAALAEQMQVPREELKRQTVYCKTVDWTVAQLALPMEGVLPDPPSPPWRCLESPSEAVVVAGDFMTHASFVGCYSSADAAADAVLRRLS